MLAGFLAVVLGVLSSTVVVARASHGSSRSRVSARSSSSTSGHVRAHTKSDKTAAGTHDRTGPARNARRPRVSLEDLSRSEAVRRGALAQSVPPIAQDRGSYGTTHRATGPIHVITDPRTGRKTLTNAVEPQSDTAPKPTATALSFRPVTPTAPIAPLSTVARDERGHIQRSAAARHAFARQTGYPRG